MHLMHFSGSRMAIGFALLAALLYGISSPVSKILLETTSPELMAALLYLGAGFGMFAVSLLTKLKNGKTTEAPLTKKDFPFVLGMILLDIAAPIFLMIGLSMTTAANASLLNNFEIVTTALVAFFIFHEKIDRKLRVAIVLIVAASILLTFDDMSSFSFSTGSVFVLLACLCWGFENNCTRMLSVKNPMEIVVVKGFGAGFGALVIAFFVQGMETDVQSIIAALVLGFFAYGLSIYFYVLAQRYLGAAKTSAFYAFAPFIGAGISFAVFRTELTPLYAVAALVMVIGAYFAARGGHRHFHYHAAVTHDHLHSHDDGHHTHVHDPPVEGEHSHVHTHEPVKHSHPHEAGLHHESGDGEESEGEGK
ncbi:MAG: EamA family transporter [Methanocorpusculum sp.]|nr:EamA family transporter [Methanocorpusculum sp.]MDD3256648.1 EamA family transporter [Methanocorpusculum sp.]